MNKPDYVAEYIRTHATPKRKVQVHVSFCSLMFAIANYGPEEGSWMGLNAKAEAFAVSEDADYATHIHFYTTSRAEARKIMRGWVDAGDPVVNRIASVTTYSLDTPAE